MSQLKVELSQLEEIHDILSEVSESMKSKNATLHLDNVLFNLNSVINILRFEIDSE